MQQIIEAIQGAGGRPVLVGGAVRDYLLGVQPKDYDIEVYGLSAEGLTEVLERFGTVRAVGKSFGVLKFSHNGQEFDFSLPRRDNKNGRGHKGFMVQLDPTMTPKEAAYRRAYTIDSMAQDLVTGELIDPYGGQCDLKLHVLRATSEKFGEDPLRVLRGMWLAGRYRLMIDDCTAKMCWGLLREYDTLSKERIWAEWQKWARSPYPGWGLAVLRQTEWITLYPELYDLVGCVQDPKWHPEGDAWTHTCLAVEHAAGLTVDPERRELLVFAALCHDLGKRETTVMRNGRIVSPKHHIRSAELATRFLRSIGAPSPLIKRVVPLVREHMVLVFLEQVTKQSVRRLARRLAPATIEELLGLIEADASARPPLPGGLNSKAHTLDRLARELSVREGEPKPILMGRHLIQMGLEPGPHFGPILNKAFEAQLDGQFNDLPGAIAWAQQEVL